MDILIFFKKYFLSAFGLILFLSWVLFIFFTHKTKIDYFIETASPVFWGEKVLSSGAVRKIYFEGFSGDEGGFRWSVGRHQKICAVFEKDGSPKLDESEVVIEVDVIEKLVKKNILIDVDGRSFSLSCAEVACYFNLRLSKIEKKATKCFSILIPETVNVRGDPRDLGYKFKSLSY